MTETKSEWTPTHPKAIGWWVCADVSRRWVAGPSPGGSPIGFVDGVYEVLRDITAPIRPFVETKKVEVEAWAAVLSNGEVDLVHPSEAVVREHISDLGPFKIVRLTGTVEIEA